MAWSDYVLIASGFAYMGGYFALWRRTGQLRDRGHDPTELASNDSLMLGAAALTYLWSDRARRSGDASLSRIVSFCRITQVLLLAAFAGDILLGSS